MPSLIEYDAVVAAMAALGLSSQYFNSGAFGFDRATATRFVGWLGPPDASIRPEAVARAIPIAPPWETNLARLASGAWMENFPGPAWLMPKSQWAYELDHGSREWLGGLLSAAGFDAASLAGRTDSPAIQFVPEECESLRNVIAGLLCNLKGSDFALAFPDFPVACTIHHHKQIWWISSDSGVIDRLTSLAQHQMPLD